MEAPSSHMLISARVTSAELATGSSMTTSSLKRVHGVSSKIKGSSMSFVNGVVSARTQISVRSLAADIFIFIEISKELFDFSSDGEKYYERVLCFIHQAMMADRQEQVQAKPKPRPKTPHAPSVNANADTHTYIQSVNTNVHQSPRPNSAMIMHENATAVGPGLRPGGGGQVSLGGNNTNNHMPMIGGGPTPVVGAPNIIMAQPGAMFPKDDFGMGEGTVMTAMAAGFGRGMMSNNLMNSGGTSNRTMLQDANRAMPQIPSLEPAITAEAVAHATSDVRQRHSPLQPTISTSTTTRTTTTDTTSVPASQNDSTTSRPLMSIRSVLEQGPGGTQFTSASGVNASADRGPRVNHVGGSLMAVHSYTDFVRPKSLALVNNTRDSGRGRSSVTTTRSPTTSTIAKEGSHNSAPEEQTSQGSPMGSLLEDIPEGAESSSTAEIASGLTDSTSPTMSVGTTVEMHISNRVTEGRAAKNEVQETQPGTHSGAQVSGTHAGMQQPQNFLMGPNEYGKIPMNMGFFGQMQQGQIQQSPAQMQASQLPPLIQPGRVHNQPNVHLNQVDVHQGFQQGQMPNQMPTEMPQHFQHTMNIPKSQLPSSQDQSQPPSSLISSTSFPFSGNQVLPGSQVAAFVAAEAVNFPPQVPGSVSPELLQRQSPGQNQSHNQAAGGWLPSELMNHYQAQFTPEPRSPHIRLKDRADSFELEEKQALQADPRMVEGDPLICDVPNHEVTIVLFGRSDREIFDTSRSNLERKVEEVSNHAPKSRTRKRVYRISYSFCGVDFNCTIEFQI